MARDVTYTLTLLDSDRQLLVSALRLCADTIDTGLTARMRHGQEPEWQMRRDEARRDRAIELARDLTAAEADAQGALL